MEQSLFFWFWRTSVSEEFPNACGLTEATQWQMNCCVPWWLTICCEFRTINSIVKTLAILIKLLINRMLILSCILQKRQGTLRLAQHQAVRGNIFPVVQKRHGSTKKGFKRNQFTRKKIETIFFPKQCVHAEDGNGLVDQFSIFFPSDSAEIVCVRYPCAFRRRRLARSVGRGLGLRHFTSEFARNIARDMFSHRNNQPRNQQRAKQPPQHPTAATVAAEAANQHPQRYTACVFLLCPCWWPRLAMWSPALPPCQRDLWPNG